MTDLHINIIHKPLAPASHNEGFERMYLSIREKERRVYTDNEVALLPSIHSNHIHYKEWLVRKRSANRLFNYLEKKQQPLSMLEVGCGNGWLIANMAALAQSSAMGIDINKTELDQAKRVFGKKNNLEFLQTGLDQHNLQDRKFDVIIFAASMSYFDSLENAILKAFSFLNKEGEIHIIDNFLYKSPELDAARQRAIDYCKLMGHAEMAGYYFHHCIDSLKSFNYKTLFNPAGIKNKILGSRDPFPWICITNK